MGHDGNGLSPEFWARPRVADALNKCDMATLLDEVRAAQGWTQSRLAHEVGYSQSWVSKVLRGHQMLSVDQIRDVARTLGVPQYLLRIGDRGGEDPTKRRDFSKIAFLAALPVAPSISYRAADETTAASLAAITGAQRRLEADTPARELARGAVAHVELTKRALARSAETPFAVEVCPTVSEAAGFAAWLHADMQDIGTARMFYRFAVDSARRADHPLLEAYMLGSLAAFEIDHDDPQLGLSMIAQARAQCGAKPPPTARAWLACIEALGHAARLDVSAALRCLREAEQAVAAGQRMESPPWPWVFPFDPGKLAGYRALVMVRLSRPQDAVAAFAESLISVRPAAKQQALLMLEVATARRMAGELDEAFTLAQEALKAGVVYSSERVLQRVRRFRRDYEGPPSLLVREFDERLRSTSL
ncbi:helix-turn-helix domain-containing protein [Acrocarpospora catenulata]|uniref:helix-turn-helix domain-containing protein n=1 Tax=Acrocarpospora catenulata TaxID=2836182 RepID=UPI001BDAA544|nr:helix-turn-helix transcriptional regulator [Acrocarpospora catenulata]